MAIQEIFCDESCTGGDHKKLVIAGTLIESAERQRLSRRIDNWRTSANMNAELKWTKVSEGRLSEYKGFVDGAFNWIDKGTLCFRSAVFTNSEIRYSEFHDGNETLGIFRFFYQLILHCHVPRTDPGDKIMVYPDKRNLKDYKLTDLRDALNRGIVRKHGFQRNTVASIEPVDSRTSNLAQINDVLMGAVGFHNNGRHLDHGCRPAKKCLAEHVSRKAGLTSLQLNTPSAMTHFGIWQFAFGAGSAGAKKGRPDL